MLKRTILCAAALALAAACGGATDEFAAATPDVKRFAQQIDEELSRINEDYAPHRQGDLAMLVPEVRVVKRGGFAEWMKARGKYGGQNKVPRMDNSGQMTKDMANWFAEHGYVET
jgi:hypothetical protein